MRLPFLRSRFDGGGSPRPGPDADEPGSLQALRTQARRRLIGALVLLLAAVVGFPLLFETQPRPLPGQAGADGAAPLIRAENGSRSAGAEVPAAAPVQRPASAARPASAPPAPPASAAVLADASERPPAAAEKPKVAASAAASAPTAPTAKKPPSVATTTPATTSATTAAPTSATTAAQTPTPAASAPGTEAAARWVVQVGAYNDMERMRAARQKAEKLGFKTYITDVDTPTGKRTRVRLGPFASKKEAEAAAAKVKANGMAANVLGL